MHVHLLTCAELPDLYPDDHYFRDALRSAGHSVSVGVWGIPPPTDTTVVVIRSCWDYFHCRDEFLSFLDGLDVPIHNHPGVIRWNSDKLYLKDMEEAGCVIVPTSFDGTVEGVAADEVVIKPRISNGGHCLWRCRREEATPAAIRERYGDRPVLAQPFMPAIQDGEYSAIQICGQLTHVIHKRPAAGEFRVQHYHGGQYSRVRSITPDLRRHIDLAFSAVCSLTGHSPLYVRYDFMCDEHSNFYLSEVELIEPLLHFDLCPEAAAEMVKGLDRRHG